MAFSLIRLLVLARLIVWVLRCGGADWCGLVLGRVESWVGALGFSPFFSFPGPPGFTRAADQKEFLVAQQVGICDIQHVYALLSAVKGPRNPDKKRGT